MGEGTGDGVEAAALPTPSVRGHAHRSRDMRIIGRDGQEFRPGVEGGIRPHGSGSGRPPTMVGRPHTGAWRTGPQTPYVTTPRGRLLGKCGSLGIMGADDGREFPRRDTTNLTPPPPPPPHPPKGGAPKKIWAADGTCIYTGRGTLIKFWVAGEDVYRSGSGALVQEQPNQPVTARHPP